MRTLRRTLNGPVGGLETDICLTSDGDLVLLHDPLLTLGTTLNGWAHERTTAELRAGRLLDGDGPSDEPPMFLSELARDGSAGAPSSLEVKAHADPELARRTAAAHLRPLGPGADRVEVISFHGAACAEAAAAATTRVLSSGRTTHRRRSPPGPCATASVGSQSSTSC